MPDHENRRLDKESMMPGFRRFGYKLHDALVAFALLLILSILLLPALSASREAARLAQCQANLKKIGLAFLAYQEMHIVFPPGMVAGHHEKDLACSYVARADFCDRPNSASASAFTMLLPFLEKPTYQGVYGSYNFDLASCSGANATSAGTIINHYLCPANDRGATRIKAGYSAGDVAPLDYGLAMGTNSLLTCAIPWGLSPGLTKYYPGNFRAGAGTFNINSSTSRRHYRDGTTNTAMLGEIAGGGRIRVADPLLGFDVNNVNGTNALDDHHVVDQWWAQGHISNDVRNGAGSVFAATGFDLWYPSSREKQRVDGDRKYIQWQPIPAAVGNSPGYTPLKLNMNKLKWIRGTFYARSLSDLMQPGATSGNSMGLENGNPYRGKPRGFSSTEFSVSPFRSFHPNASNFLMADGSVRLITEPVEQSILNALVTVSGGE